MDSNCVYINNKGNCESPKDEGNESECRCSNHNNCYLYPQYNLIIKGLFEQENALETEVKK